MSDEPETFPDMTAAELALGVLEGEERAAALRRVLADPAFARDVEQWRSRLASLYDDYANVTAPETVAERLAAPVEATRQRWAWPIVAATAALAAMITFVLVSHPERTRPPVPAAIPHHVMAASLMLADKSTSVPALVDVTAGQVSIQQVAMAPAGKSAQLWSIGRDGVPKPLGLLSSTGTSRIVLTPDQRRQLVAGLTLAVSVEPVGGSPTGKPTGPIVATGKLLAI